MAFTFLWVLREKNHLRIYKSLYFPKPKMSACTLVFLTASSWHQLWLRRRLLPIKILKKYVLLCIVNNIGMYIKCLSICQLKHCYSSPENCDICENARLNSAQMRSNTVSNITSEVIAKITNHESQFITSLYIWKCLRLGWSLIYITLS